MCEKQECLKEKNIKLEKENECLKQKINDFEKAAAEASKKSSLDFSSLSGPTEVRVKKYTTRDTHTQ